MTRILAAVVTLAILYPMPSIAASVLDGLSVHKRNLPMSVRPDVRAQNCGREYTRCTSDNDCCNFLRCDCTTPTRPGDSRECQCR
jgi:hypothetical protein